VTFVVDTNVLLVANRQHKDVSEACIDCCATRLHGIVQSGRVAIDDGYRILNEYQNKTEPYAGKRVGDAFLKWLLRNNANPQRCEQVGLVEHTKRGFESFPDDARLEQFDHPDRKFVAVAALHPAEPPILQAADSKWLGWAPALKDHGVKIDFLCPTDITAFEGNKKRKAKGI
jgi:hypothetical protein